MTQVTQRTPAQPGEAAERTIPQSTYLIGMRDAKHGYYDKWYRYNHRDNGAMYDAGYEYGGALYNVPSHTIIAGRVTV
ncbi:MAG: hypothetical protein FWB90_00710 [Fibromonadales bacterium]|nr:hypothetical protein [Fibromonadales bacterium]